MRTREECVITFAAGQSTHSRPYLLYRIWVKFSSLFLWLVIGLEMFSDGHCTASVFQLIEMGDNKGFERLEQTQTQFFFKNHMNINHLIHKICSKCALYYTVYQTIHYIVRRYCIFPENVYVFGRWLCMFKVTRNKQKGPSLSETNREQIKLVIIFICKSWSCWHVTGDQSVSILWKTYNPIFRFWGHQTTFKEGRNIQSSHLYTLHSSTWSFYQAGWS